MELCYRYSVNHISSLSILPSTDNTVTNGVTMVRLPTRMRKKTLIRVLHGCQPAKILIDVVESTIGHVSVFLHLHIIFLFM